MRFSRKPPVIELPGISGAARVDRRTPAAIGRARSGDVLVLAHQDMDRATAQAIAARGVAAVINTRPFISGRYPNLGPELLVDRGVLLVEVDGERWMHEWRDGVVLRVHDGEIHAGEEHLVTGRVLTASVVAAEMEAARTGLVSQLQSFTHNATEFLRREQDLLLHGLGAPGLRTVMTGRPVVVVAPGVDAEQDLRRLRRFIDEQRPVLVGVDVGVELLHRATLRPHLAVVGTEGLAAIDEDEALRRSREVVLHTDRAGRVGGAERLEALGIRPQRFPTDATTEDLALLLAEIGDASVIVCVGTHATLDEFLDRHRPGLASTFLTRLRVGPRLVDARAVPDLYVGRVRLWQLLLVLLVGLLALGVAVAATPVGNEWWLAVRDAVETWVRGLL